jgi:hypothetical protein
LIETLKFIINERKRNKQAKPTLGFALLVNASQSKATKNIKNKHTTCLAAVVLAKFVPNRTNQSQRIPMTTMMILKSRIYPKNIMKMIFTIDCKKVDLLLLRLRITVIRVMAVAMAAIHKEIVVETLAVATIITV